MITARHDGGGGRSTLVGGDPDALDAYSERAAAAVDLVTEAFDAYQAAMSALVRAPIDAHRSLPSPRGWGIAEALANLRATCRAPAAFAGALRLLDADGDGAISAADGIDADHLELFLLAWQTLGHVPADATDPVGLHGLLRRHAGLPGDADRVRDELAALLGAGAVSPGDLTNPALIAYLFERDDGVLDVVEEFDLSGIEVAADGTLGAFGLRDWDPAVLAHLQRDLDASAASEADRAEEAHRAMPGYGMSQALGHGSGPDFDAIRHDLHRTERGSFLAHMARQVDRGFYSADRFDRLADQADAGTIDPRQRAELFHAVQAHATGATPIYQMTGWEKFRDGVGTVAAPVGIVATGAMFVPGLQVPAGAARGAAVVAGTAAAVDITDACVVNRSDRCASTVAVSSIPALLRVGPGAIRSAVAASGDVLTVADERVIRGMEMFRGVAETGIGAATATDAIYDLDRPGQVEPRSVPQDPSG